MYHPIKLICLALWVSACSSVLPVRADLDSVLVQGTDQCLHERARWQRPHGDSVDSSRARPGATDERISSLIDTIGSLQRQQLTGQQRLAETILQALKASSGDSNTAHTGLAPLLALAHPPPSSPSVDGLLAQIAKSIASAQQARERGIALEAALAWHSLASYRLCEANLNGWSMSRDETYMKNIVTDYELSRTKLNALLVAGVADPLEQKK